MWRMLGAWFLGIATLCGGAQMAQGDSGTYAAPLSLHQVQSIEQRISDLRKGMTPEEVSNTLGLNLKQMSYMAHGHNPRTYLYDLWTRQNPADQPRHTHNLLVVFSYNADFSKASFERAELVKCGVGTKPKPENLTMTLAWIADAGEPKQYVFVINGVVAYRTLDGLKKYLKDVPKGSSLTWAPGCGRVGNEPLIGSQEEMASFQNFCDSLGIQFTLVPSG